MKFKMTLLGTSRTEPEFFDENSAPEWLCEGGYPVSTMCNLWFCIGFALKLKVGEYVDTDLRRITRVE